MRRNSALNPRRPAPPHASGATKPSPRLRYPLGLLFLQFYLCHRTADDEVGAHESVSSDTKRRHDDLRARGKSESVCRTHKKRVSELSETSGIRLKTNILILAHGAAVAAPTIVGPRCARSEVSVICHHLPRSFERRTRDKKSKCASPRVFLAIHAPFRETTSARYPRASTRVARRRSRS